MTKTHSPRRFAPVYMDAHSNVFGTCSRACFACMVQMAETEQRKKRPFQHRSLHGHPCYHHTRYPLVHTTLWTCHTHSVHPVVLVQCAQHSAGFVTPLSVAILNCAPVKQAPSTDAHDTWSCVLARAIRTAALNATTSTNSCIPMMRR